MPRRLVSLATLLLLLPAPPLAAKHLILQPGETHQSGDTTVICVGTKEGAPVEISDCQHWDGFNQRCLFESRTFYHGDLQCVEECQHWDSFAGRCDYATRCTFHPGRQVFIRTSCETFDSFNHTCTQKREEIIPPP